MSAGREIDAWLSTQEAKHQQITRKVAKAGLIVEAFWTAACLAIGPFWRSAAWNALASASFYLVLLLQRSGQRYAARIALIVLTNGWIFIFASLYGGKNGTQLCFLPMSSLPFMILPSRQRLATAFGVVLPLTLFILLEFTEYRLFPPVMVLPLTKWTYFLTLMTAFYMSWLLIVIFRSENERVETELQESQARFLGMLEASREGICVTDAAGKIDYVNPAFNRMIGTGRMSLIGRPLLELVPSASRDDAVEALWGSGQAPGPERAEIDFVREDGQVRTAWVSSNPVRGIDQDSRAVIVLVLDVTESREKEKLIGEMRNQMVSSAKLSALGEMAAGIAHEIDNPLSALRMGTGLLNRAVSEKDLEKAATIARQTDATAQRIVEIVAGLKSFSRDDPRNVQVDVPLAKVIEDTVALCREQFKTNRVRLIVGPVPPDLVIHARPVQISQVLMNLLSNALHALTGTPDAQVRIDFLLVDGQVEISVTDNGPGVPSELQARIFDAFFTTKPTGVGTGLGLSISRGIVQAHGGRIAVDSRPGLTTFRFLLPVRSVALNPAA